MPSSARDEKKEGETQIALLGIAAIALGWAIQVRDGLYDPVAFVGLTLALLATFASFYAPKIPLPSPRWVFGLGIVLNFFLWLAPHRLPGSWHGPSATSFFYLCISLAFAICLGIVLFPQINRLLLLLALVLFAVLGSWMILRVPQPYMDVWMLQTEGLKSFLHGHNPFSTPFADIYHRSELYAPGVKDANGFIHQGFPYPPMVLWFELPGQFFGGDYRWSCLGAMLLAALFIGTATRSRLGPMAAVMFLFTPRALFVLESGWTEPITALLLTVTVWGALRAPRVMPVWLGLFLCSKQYLIWAVPPIILLAGRPMDRPKLLRILILAALSGCVASLPLILWNVHAYLSANVDVAQGAGFRTDALSYLALWANVTHHLPSPRIATVIGFLSASIVTAFACRRAAATPAGYAAAVAVGHLTFFAFYKFAFCNYEWFVICALCTAAATKHFENQSDEGVSPSSVPDLQP